MVLASRAEVRDNCRLRSSSSCPHLFFFLNALSQSWHFITDYVCPCVKWSAQCCFSQDTYHWKYLRKNYKTLMELAQMLKQFLTSCLWKQSIIVIQEIDVNKFCYYPWQGRKRWILVAFSLSEMIHFKFYSYIKERWHDTYIATVITDQDLYDRRST